MLSWLKFESGGSKMVSTENMDEQEWTIIDGKLCERSGIDKKVIAEWDT